MSVRRNVEEKIIHSMRETGFSAEECIRNFQSYIDKIDEIVGLFDNHGRISRENVPEARELLKKLKDSLKSDYKLRDTNKGREAMSDVECAFFFPAIHEAWTSIYVKANSVPSEQWVRELLDAKSKIRYYLNGLKGK